jgi:hypothetical protein
MLNCYEVCPRLCYEEWGEAGSPDRDDSDSKTNKYASVGIALHRTMEIWGLQKMLGNNITLLMMHDILDSKFYELDAKLFDGDEDINEYRNSLHEQLDWLWDAACQTKPLFVEKKFQYKLFNELPEFTGTIDRIEGNIESRDVEIMDYKSGKIYSRKDIKSNMQAAIYAMAFNKMYGFYPQRFVFLFSRFKKSKTIEITPDFLEEASYRIKSNWYHIVNGDFDVPAKPNKYFCTHFCTARANCPKYKKPKGWEMVG